MGGSSVHHILENPVEKVTETQEFALDLLDKLYFNQLLVFCAMNTVERQWLESITGRLEKEVSAAGYRGIAAEIAKHGVLCLVEIILADDILDMGGPFKRSREPMDAQTLEDYKRTRDFLKNYAQAWLIDFYQSTKDFDLCDILDIAQKIAKDYEKAPVIIRYKLMERCFSFSYATAPIDCLWHFAKTEVVTGKKYPVAKLSGEIDTHFMARLMMLCEFMEIRRYLKRASSREDLSHELVSLAQNSLYASSREKLVALSQKRVSALMDKNQQKKYAHFDLDQLESQEQYQQFFEALNKNHTHYRIDSGSLGGWLGTLGAAQVEIDLAASNKQLSIYTEINNDGTITDKITRKLQDRGFSITARTLYERHKTMRAHALPCVKKYYKFQKNLNVAINPELDDIGYLAIVPMLDASTPKWRLH